MPRRLLVAAVIAGALTFLGSVAPAGAGISATIEVDEVCNSSTGEYDLTITVTNAFVDAGTIIVDDFQIDGNDETLTFAPNPVPGSGGVSVATFSAPGDSTAVFVDLTIDYANFDTDLSSELTLAGDCVPDVTTTTTTSTTLPTTTVTAAASPIALQPAFTG